MICKFCTFHFIQHYKWKWLHPEGRHSAYRSRFAFANRNSNEEVTSEVVAFDRATEEWARGSSRVVGVTVVVHAVQAN